MVSAYKASGSCGDCNYAVAGLKNAGEENPMASLCKTRNTKCVYVHIIFEWQPKLGCKSGN